MSRGRRACGQASRGGYLVVERRGTDLEDRSAVAGVAVGGWLYGARSRPAARQSVRARKRGVSQRQPAGRWRCWEGCERAGGARKTVPPDVMS